MRTKFSTTVDSLYHVEDETEYRYDRSKYGRTQVQLYQGTSIATNFCTLVPDLVLNLVWRDRDSKIISVLTWHMYYFLKSTYF